MPKIKGNTKAYCSLLDNTKRQIIAGKRGNKVKNTLYYA